MKEKELLRKQEGNQQTLEPNARGIERFKAEGRSTVLPMPTGIMENHDGEFWGEESPGEAEKEIEDVKSEDGELSHGPFGGCPESVRGSSSLSRKSFSSSFSILSLRRELVNVCTPYCSRECTQVVQTESWEAWLWILALPSSQTSDFGSTFDLFTYYMKESVSKREPEAGLGSVLVHNQEFT